MVPPQPHQPHQRQRFEAFFAASDALVFFATLPTATAPVAVLREANPALCARLGWDQTELVGRPWSLMHPPEAPERSRVLFDTLATAGSATFHSHLMARDGRLVSVDLRIVVIDESGSPLALCMAREVSDTVAASPPQAESFYQTLVANTLDVLAVLDPDGTIRYESPSITRLGGWAEQELVGSNSFTYIHPDDLPGVLAALGTVMITPGAEGMAEYRFRHRDGSWRWVQSLGTNRLTDPLVRGIVVSSRDITDQRQLAANLEQAQRLDGLGRLAGGVAHDFNNILTGILGWADLINRRHNGSETADFAAQIVRSAERAAALTRQLLAFSRRQEVAPRVLDVATECALQEPLLRRLIGERIDFTVDIPQGLRIFVDAGQFEQLVMNLVLNARDALPEGGHVRLAATTATVGSNDHRIDGIVVPGQFVAIAVSDSGVGMTPEVQARVFEPFFTTKAQGKGTGLGLAVVHGIVTAAKGWIGIDSTLGGGTTVTMLLPVSQGQFVPYEIPSCGDAMPSGTETVLLVEDEVGVRNLVATLLRSAGYQVLVATDGREGLALIESHLGVLDLLLTDVVMPRMGGPELVAAARILRPNLAVLYMSGYHEVSLAQDAEVVDKPFTAGDLMQRVRKTLGRVQQGRACVTG